MIHHGEQQMFAMPAAIELRTDFTEPELCQRARDTNQTRRQVALAVINDGGSRSGAAHVGSGGLRMIRMPRFNANGDPPEGTIDRKAPGPTPRRSHGHAQATPAVPRPLGMRNHNA